MTQGGLGAEVFTEHENTTAFLFSESQSRFVISVSPAKQAAFEELTGAKPIGSVTGKGNLLIEIGGERVINIPTKILHDIWGGAIECLLKQE
jgi:phosphoribosylformylglycinamidine synthase